ncbi:MAG: hypothetical protein ACOCTH_02815 [Halodesulfurarchaeum sp.]
MSDFEDQSASEIERTVEFMEEIHTKLGSGEYEDARLLATELHEGAECGLCSALGTSMMGACIWAGSMPMDGTEWRAKQVMKEIETWLDQIGRPVLEDQLE